ncbi:hypothetical protein D3C80_1175970 [compost metagenome]
MPVAAIGFDLALAGELVGHRERHAHLFVQGKGNTAANLPGVAKLHVTRHLAVDLRADIAERVLHVVGVRQAAEQHGRVEGLDQRDARRDRPHAVAGRQAVRHCQVVVAVYFAQLDAIWVLAGRRLDPQGGNRVRPGLVLVEELVGHAHVDIADFRVAGDGCIGGGRPGASRTAGRVGRFAIHHGDVDVELPALRQVVARGHVQGPVVGLDPVKVDTAEEDRIQCQEAIERQRTGIVMGVGDTRFEAELATAKESAGLVIQVGNALRRLGIGRQRLAVRAACGAWRA